MKKKKKGSALVLVLMVFTILSILGIAISSLSISTYKMRILKSNVKTGLYASEAGIDEAYGKIGESIDEAIDVGNTEVDKFMQDLNENLGKAIEAKKTIKRLGELGKIQEKEKAEEEYKEKQYEKYEKYMNEDFTINEETIKEDQNIKFREAYVKEITKDENGQDESTIKDSIGECSTLIGKLNNQNAYEFKLSDNETKPKIEASVNEKSNIDYESKKMEKLLTINIASTFKHKGVEKKLKADYDILVPPYEEAYYMEENHFKIAKNPVWTKAIAVDGNMNVKSNINVDGDIYVKGNEQSTGDHHGININATGTHNFNGDIATGENFNVLSNGSECIIEKDLFVKNLLLKESASAANVNITGSLYTKDDLEIDAKESSVVIDRGYYGLSDGSNSKTSDESSSININAVKPDGSLACNLDIKGESIIMGTSYVNVTKPGTNEKYQTGESLSIKGNYKAYTQPLTGLLKNSDKITDEEKKEYDKFTHDNIEFDYYEYKTSDGNNPFMEFVSRYYDKDDSKGKDLTAIDKSKYFKFYNEEYGANSGLNWGNVKINKDSIYTGAIITDDGVEFSTYLLDVGEKIKDKNKKFSEMVYNMGESLKNEDTLPKSVLKTVKGQLNIDGINDIKEETHDCGEDGVIVLAKRDYELDSKITKGVIIVDGNVTIKGDFIGTIIATGDINILGNSKIRYDENVVKNLIASNYDVLNGVFTNNSEEECDVQLSPNIGAAEGLKSSIKKDKLIKMRNWTILK